MQKEDVKITKNKKIWKWTIINLSLIIFGVSIIGNITYLPKYFALKNRNDNALKIDISCYDDTGISGQTKLFYFQYQSLMATLGDLMTQYQNTYILENGGTLGRKLTGVKYYDDKQDKEIILEGKLSPGSKYYWAIYYNKNLAPVGIDSLYLKMNDTFELRYTKIN